MTEGVTATDGLTAIVVVSFILIFCSFAFFDEFPRERIYIFIPSFVVCMAAIIALFVLNCNGC